MSWNNRLIDLLPSFVAEHNHTYTDLFLTLLSPGGSTALKYQAYLFMLTSVM